MARQLRFMSAGRTHRDERGVPAEQRRGNAIVLRVVSEDLKHQPVHEIELTPEQALVAIRDLASAITTLGR